MHILLALLLLPIYCTVPSPAEEAPADEASASDDTLSIEVEEWEVPWAESRPRDPYVAPDGKVWFVGQRSDYVAVLDPDSGEFEKFDLEGGTGPHNLIVADDGRIWFAGNLKGYVGILDPETGEIEKIMMPEGQANDPHTLAFGPDGSIWFTAQVANVIGHLDPETRTVQLARVETPSARPYGIEVDAAGRPWVALLGTNKLATVERETMQVVEVPLPREGAHPRRLGITSDGAVWYVDYEGGHLGRYDPEAMDFEEWELPGGTGSRPYGMAVDGRDRVWVVETGGRPNRLLGFDPELAQFVSSTEIPSGGGTVRHMYFHPQTESIWFGTDTNTIARVVVR